MNCGIRHTSLALPILISYCLTFCEVDAQDENNVRYVFKSFQFSLVPGLGTNGINPGQYINGVSLNIFSGYSAGNTFFECSGLSSFNKYSSSGIQLSGLINTIGGDLKLHRKYRKEELELLKSGYEGLQVSGVANVLTGDFSGAQITTGINLLWGSSTGFQFGGLVNLNKGYFTGFQFAGLINFTASYTSGFHLSGALNYSTDALYGIQLAPFNRASTLYGVDSPVDMAHGLQIGIFNFAKDMDGYQIGLVNRARHVRGIQFGLINIYRKNREGIPIGLINYGYGSESLRLWMSETFILNTGLSTGSKKVRNTLFFSYNPINTRHWPRRAFGYALARIWHPEHGARFRSIEITFSWINFNKTIKDNPFNLLITPRYIYGVHINRGIYFNIGLGLNYYAYPYQNQEYVGFFSGRVWPSLVLGFHSD